MLRMGPQLFSSVLLPPLTFPKYEEKPKNMKNMENSKDRFSMDFHGKKQLENHDFEMCK